MVSVGSGSSLQQYQYDAFNMMTTMQTTSEARGYVYTADDERLIEFDFTENPLAETWSLRDLGGNLIRQWTVEEGSWSWTKDYLHRGPLLLATEEPGATHHLHLDHLGTPRLITRGNGSELSRHTYFPYGAEITSTTQDDEERKFTGHERDFGGAGEEDDLDYMHARHIHDHKYVLFKRR